MSLNNQIQCRWLLPLSPGPARKLVELDAFVAAVGYHEEVVPGPHHPCEPDEQSRVHAQHCRKNRGIIAVVGSVEIAAVPKVFRLPPVILPDIISGGFLVSATLCKTNRKVQRALSAAVLQFTPNLE